MEIPAAKNTEMQQKLCTILNQLMKFMASMSNCKNNLTHKWTG